MKKQLVLLYGAGILLVVSCVGYFGGSRIYLYPLVVAIVMVTAWLVLTLVYMAKRKGVEK